MARKRASMREGPLAELFKATEAAQRQQEEGTPADAPPPEEPHESTVEHVPTWEDEVETPSPPRPDPQPEPPPQPDPVPDPVPDPTPSPPPPTVPEPPVTRYYEPMPEPAPRLSHARVGSLGSYLAKIQVVAAAGPGRTPATALFD